MNLLGQRLTHELLVGLMTGELVNVGGNAGDDGNDGGHRAKLSLIGGGIGFVKWLQLSRR